MILVELNAIGRAILAVYTDCFISMLCKYKRNVKITNFIFQATCLEQAGQLAGLPSDRNADIIERNGVQTGRYSLFLSSPGKEPVF